ncbi:MAG: DUF362 domain-containing protein [Candidatus Lokiarchaeota archaeon]|nr:DUF362 domain-containing protein [Candidatus Lokiarchaeota archaeon]
MKAQVAIIDLEKTSSNPVEEAIKLLGGIDDLDTTSREVALKVGIYHPDGTMYSTPEIVDKIVQAFKRTPKVNIVETDNYIDGGMERLRKVYSDIFSDRIVPVNLSKVQNTVSIHVENSVREIVIELARSVMKPTVFVNTHVLRTYNRGSILKNLFGLPPEKKKAPYHKNEIFYNLLTGLFEAIGGVDLSILDGTYLHKFSKGRSVQAEMNLIVVGRDAVAVETVGAHLAGLKPEKMQIIQSFVKKGLGIGNLEDIEILGARLEDMEKRYKVAKKIAEKKIKKLPEPWSAAKTINKLIDAGFFSVERRTLDTVIAACIEQDPRAHGKKKMLYTTMRRRLKQGKVQGEKLAGEWVFWN